jgi:quercetin dioxygenase-like cupin family protein
MNRSIAVLAALVLTTNAALAQQHAATKSANAPVTGPAAANFGPAPAVFPAGAQMAVLAGDPGKGGEYTVRLKMPNGYKIAPHFHPTDENVTVLSGTFHVGIGDKFVQAGMLSLPSGGFITAGAQMHHYAWAEGPTIVQVHGMGPFKLTYVNAADDPSAHKK